MMYKIKVVYGKDDITTFHREKYLHALNKFYALCASHRSLMVRVALLKDNEIITENEFDDLEADEYYSRILREDIENNKG